jgi:hypothetical protein
MVWNSATEFWDIEPTQEQGVRLCVAGHPSTGPNPRAAALLVPLRARASAVAAEATAYLAREFSAQASLPVAESELRFVDISAYGGKSEYVEANFEWDEEPDWLIRVSLQDGHPVSWGFDD